MNFNPVGREASAQDPLVSDPAQPLSRFAGFKVQFYHLTATPLERALPKLLEKALAGGFKTLLVAESDERVEQLNQLLWTYDPGSFLPHGSAKDGNAEQQPILICHSAARDSESAKSIEILRSRMRASQDDKILLLVTNGTAPDQPEAFERILDMFDGNDAQAVANARTRWKAYKEAGHEISYMKQTAQGGWEKAA